MLARWLAKLQQFHFDIEHRPGAQHGNADGLSLCPQCERGSCAPTTKTHQTDPDQPYANSCGGFSMDSERIPLESGETCVAAIMTAQSDNSKRIIAAQKIDKDISIVRVWISSGQFPECVQDFTPASYELKAYWIGRKSLYLEAEDILWRTRSATGSRAQLVVPLSLRDTVFNDSHHTTYGGHFGMTHTHTQQDTVTLLLAWNVRFHQGQNHCMPQVYFTQITSESPPTNGTCTSVREIRTCGYGSVGRICHLRQRT